MFLHRFEKVDAPGLFMLAFKVLKPFLSKETLAKVHFVKRTGTFGPRKTMDEAFAKVFDEDQLEDEYGGTLTRSVWYGVLYLVNMVSMVVLVCVFFVVCF